MWQRSSEGAKDLQWAINERAKDWRAKDLDPANTKYFILLVISTKCLIVVNSNTHQVIL